MPPSINVSDQSDRPRASREVAAAFRVPRVERGAGKFQKTKNRTQDGRGGGREGRGEKLSQTQANV